MSARTRTAVRPGWMETPKPLTQAAKALALVAVVLLVCVPFLVIVSTSLASTDEVVEGGGWVLWPTEPTLDAYRDILDGGIVTHALGVSAGVTIVGTLLSLACTVTLAYALSRPGVFGGKPVLLLILFTFLFPPGMIPSFLLVKEDLTPYLSGEAIADYPNLANIPTHAWRDMGRIGGRIFGIPLERPLPGSTLWLNRDLFADAGMTEGWSADDFAAVAKRATSGRTYGLGAAAGSLFGNAVHSAAHNAPQEWAVTKDGAFQPGWADERFKASIAFQARLRKDGSYHPDATSISQIDLTTLYYNGTVGSMQDGFGAYLPKYRESKGKLTPAAALPYSVDGEPGGIVAARRSFGYTVLKKAKKERVELLLRILDYLAAPFGSQEWELVHYGVEGTHFTRGKDGSPTPTKLGEVENNTNLPLKYLAEGPQVLFVPGMPDAVRALHAWQLKTVPHAVRNASYGLQSRTKNAQGTTLKALLDDTVTGIVAGRVPLSEWDGAVKKWRDRGGDRMAEEFAKDYAANT
ncbi:extracellular solute-binding protein [Streptomyces sp. NBC_01373]|uniref:extracellular solute-binding protein n=1 Tax=Streptomyces sp. NBC_01373 TaxID=2903843 RepID=UPI002256532C|nr:extracellular solute-binding protein [Streptomyces sp. NBC_01373]MCX4701827.1 extracellular solute-binding protein [Streptomyces sp. NBC_01373]